MNSIFNSRDTKYKSPFGAVPSGTVIKLRIQPPQELRVSSALLVANFEQSKADYHVDMTRLAPEDGSDIFEVNLETGSYTGLIMYIFRIECRYGTRYITNSGMSEQDGPLMQITVYSPSFQEATWFSEGIIYQIFPDRFYRTEIPAAPKRKRIHQSWDEQPQFAPGIDEETGEYLWNNDFFGGSLSGIISKLDYLAELGVSILYLNPIFEAFSNHRYDTACYERVDPLLGNNSDFTELCRQCHERGIRVILDGVFNHTGSDSVYFNQIGTYDSLGANQSPHSPYYKWYDFQSFPDHYSSWWGIKTLPAVNELDPSYMDYIVTGENSIVKRWLKMGADGWRLDVADELPDEFIRQINMAAREAKPDSVIIGEVWEDASNKTAYDIRRKHLWGGYLDGVMNYPLRQSIISFLLGGSSWDFIGQMETLRENYPRAAFYGSMNFLGTHDTVRIMNVLAQVATPESKEEQAAFEMSPREYNLAKTRLKLASLLLSTFPGAFTIYYGDEAGMCGFADPFNRATYPWGDEDMELVDWYKLLCSLRCELPALRKGDITYFNTRADVLAYARHFQDDTVYSVINAGHETATLHLPWAGGNAHELISNRELVAANGQVTIQLSPQTGAVISKL